jgi:hypothetical protein
MVMTRWASVWDVGGDAGGFADEVEEVLDRFDGVGDFVGDGGGHAAPVVELAQGEEGLLHAGLFVFGVGEAAGVVVDAEADGFRAADEHERDVSGESGGDDVGPGVDPEERDPGGDDVHEVGGTAGDDEESEADAEPGPVAGDDLAGVADEVEQGEADEGVVEEGDGVGDGHRPDECGVCFPADCVGHQRDRWRHQTAGPSSHFVSKR